MKDLPPIVRWSSVVLVVAVWWFTYPLDDYFDFMSEDTQAVVCYLCRISAVVGFVLLCMKDIVKTGTITSTRRDEGDLDLIRLAGWVLVVIPFVIVCAAVLLY